MPKGWWKTSSFVIIGLDVIIMTVKGSMFSLSEQNAQPLAFKGKLLLVEVTSSAWLHELQFLKGDIIKNLNDALGKELISEIKFKIGSFR